MTAPEAIACSAEPMAEDMVVAPARMPPAAPVGKFRKRAPNTTTARLTKLQMTARMVNFRPSSLRLLRKEGPTRNPTPYMNK
ncbi:hypothetical protein D3C81_1397030 [compost metagenome]